jgi:excinuclease ABC subunit C
LELQNQSGGEIKETEETQEVKKETKAENGFAVLPDLILLDGGKGHVSAIQKTLQDFGSELISSVPVFGMVKDDFHKTRSLTDGESEINIAKDQSVFIFFYKIQEEVHRFSLKRMDTRRRKTVKQSALHDIKGLGNAKIKNLFEHFKSADEIKKAAADELIRVKGITKANAESIINYFAGEKNGGEDKEKSE